MNINLDNFFKEGAISFEGLKVILSNIINKLKEIDEKKGRNDLKMNEKIIETGKEKILLNGQELERNYIELEYEPIGKDNILINYISQKNKIGKVISSENILILKGNKVFFKKNKINGIITDVTKIEPNMVFYVTYKY